MNVGLPNVTGTPTMSSSITLQWNHENNLLENLMRALGIMVLSKCVSTSVHTFGRTFMFAKLVYGFLYQSDSGYDGIRSET